MIAAAIVYSIVIYAHRRRGYYYYIYTRGNHFTASPETSEALHRESAKLASGPIRLCVIISAHENKL
jgi:hypothetical protein